MSDLTESEPRGSAGSARAQTARLLRDRSGLQRVTNIELFFDLVYVFAVTQLSHYCCIIRPGRARCRPGCCW